MTEKDCFAFLARGASFNRKASVSRLFADAPAITPTVASASEQLDFFAEPGAAEDKTQHQHREHVMGAGVASFEDADAVTSADAAVEWRSMHGVQMDGDDVTLPMTSMHELRARFRLRKGLVHNIRAAGWTLPTLVQSEAIPALLEKRDLIACAPTGSGVSAALAYQKHVTYYCAAASAHTAAFVIPILARLGSQHVAGGPRALIVTPTHELATQIHALVEKLNGDEGFTVCLLTNARAAKPAKWVGNGTWDIVVATPMRLLKLLQREGSPLHLDTVEILVLDEADRLFETDFVDQADGVFAACTNPALQRAMFSATIGERPERLARAIMFSPLRVIVGARVATPPHAVLQQDLVYVGTEQGKMVHFRALLHKGLEPPVLVFTQNKQRATDLYKLLISDRINVDVLTQDRSESQRAAAVDKFRDGTVWILISTDVLGRGIDFKGVNVVINWDMPKSVPDYVHRVGRTGRAGRPGRAITYFEDIDLPMAKAVAQLIRRAGGTPAPWLLQPNAPGQHKRFKGAMVATPRQRIIDGATRANKRSKVAAAASKKRKKESSRRTATGNDESE